jgi:hypothetical protein
MVEIPPLRGINYTIGRFHMIFCLNFAVSPFPRPGRGKESGNSFVRQARQIDGGQVDHLSNTIEVVRPCAL